MAILIIAFLILLTLVIGYFALVDKQHYAVPGELVDPYGGCDQLEEDWEVFDIRTASVLRMHADGRVYRVVKVKRRTLIYVMSSDCVYERTIFGNVVAQRLGARSCIVPGKFVTDEKGETRVEVKSFQRSYQVRARNWRCINAVLAAHRTHTL